MTSVKKLRDIFSKFLKEKWIELELCPCCWFPTLYQRAVYDICCICWWEDDWQDEYNKYDILGWPNWDLSLYQAQSNIIQQINYEKLLSLFQIDYNLEELINKIVQLNQAEESWNLKEINFLEKELKTFIDKKNP
jgi:hypothetical protein